MKKSVFLLAVLLSSGSLSAQTLDVWSDPAVGGEGKADPRQEFVSYVTRETAVKGDPNEAPHYLPLDGKWRVLVSTTEEGASLGFIVRDLPLRHGRK